MSFRVLICDDEKVIRTGLCKLLTQAYGDVEVAEAADGQAGCALFETWQPDLVITDIRMPVMDGLELAGRLAAQNAGSKVVILSAYSDFHYARQALRYGVADYLVKPVNRFELESLVQRRFGLSPAQPAAQPSPQEGMEAGPVAQAIAYIENNFYRSLSLEEVSRHIRVNANYLSGLFKAKTGMKYIDYLTHLRLEKADRLIRHTDLRVADIAQMVGYASVKHFGRLYREAYGANPSEVRGEVKNEPPDL
ncbi:MAG: response regulator [Candidatus Limiplasma sp.]|nr:response regulator [Candidatus Limiplasma sp.]